MIVPMQKITVLCTAASEHETLEALRDLGVLHIDFSNAETPDLCAAEASLAEAVKAFSLLETVKPTAHGAKPDTTATAADIPSKVLSISAKIADTEAVVSSLMQQIAIYSSFGEFSPTDFSALIAAGIKLNLFRGKLTDLDSTAGTASDYRILSKDAVNFYGIAFGEIPENTEAVMLPTEPLSAMHKRCNDLTQSISSLNAELRTFVPRMTELKDVIAERTSVRDFLHAQASTETQYGIVWLTGFCPEHKMADVMEAAARHGWGIAARDPRDDEEPPTLIKPPKMFRPIVTLFETLNISPGYREADVSVVFYTTFTIFFAMLVGDAGYGALILAATIFARLKFKKAPSAPFILFAVFSLATIAWGILSATYFGIPQTALPTCLKPKTAAWLGNQSNIMQLCFLIGACHLTVARLWNAVELFPSTKAIAQVGWTGVIWTMYCAACLVVVEGFKFPSFMTYVAGVSVLLIALFMLKRNELKTNGVDLAMLPLNVISSLGDIISYVRLFAVGLASVKVAENFNTMAIGLSMPLWAKIPCVVVILLLGHSLNLAMGALSILVHAVRLNTLEFSNHKGVSWSGFAYHPFKRQTNDHQ